MVSKLRGEKMNSEEVIKFSSESQETTDKAVDDVIGLAERMDFLDVQLLRKFYMTGKEFPSDTQPYCFPILYMEMKVSHKMQIGLEALRKRLDNLVSFGFLEKISSSNPSYYAPAQG